MLPCRCIALSLIRPPRPPNPGIFRGGIEDVVSGQVGENLPVSLAGNSPKSAENAADTSAADYYKESGCTCLSFRAEDTVGSVPPR